MSLMWRVWQSAIVLMMMIMMMQNWLEREQRQMPMLIRGRGGMNSLYSMAVNVVNELSIVVQLMKNLKLCLCDDVIGYDIRVS